MRGNKRKQAERTIRMVEKGEKTRGGEKCRVEWRRRDFTSLLTRLPLKWLRDRRDNGRHLRGHIPVSLCRAVAMSHVWSHTHKDVGVHTHRHAYDCLPCLQTPRSGCLCLYYWDWTGKKGPLKERRHFYEIPTMLIDSAELPRGNANAWISVGTQKDTLRGMDSEARRQTGLAPHRWPDRYCDCQSTKPQKNQLSQECGFGRVELAG